MKEKVLITGIAGAAGSYLAEYIVNEHPDVEVHGISRWHSTTSLYNLEGIKDKIIMHEGDLLDTGCIIRILRELKPKKIFNLAAHANVRVCFDNPDSVLYNNMFSTLRLLEAIRLECLDVIYNHCSTSEIYGNPIDIPITEKHPVNPVNTYAVSKLCQEALVYSYYKSWGLRVIITRAFAYICPRRGEIFSTSFARQVKNIEDGKQEFLYHGNLDSVRTLIDVRDIVRAYWVACDKCSVGVPYNIGGQEIISVREFLDLMVKKSSVPIICKQDPKLMRPTDVTNQIVDISKFVSATGFKPRYTLDQSIEFLLNHVRRNER